MKINYLIIFAVILLLPLAYAEVIVSEIVYAPSNEIGGRYAEWMEIYNPDKTAVNLSGWKIADHSNHPIEGKTLIEPKGYLIIVKSAFFSNFSNYYNVSCPIAKAGFTLNNDGETFFLIGLDNKIEILYSDFLKNYSNSIQLVDDTWCEAIPTPGHLNECPAEETANESQNPEDNNSSTNDTEIIENVTTNVTASNNTTNTTQTTNSTSGSKTVITAAATNAKSSSTSAKPVPSDNSSAENQTAKKTVYQSKTDKMRQTALYLSAGMFILLVIYFLKTNKL